jgi:hypothetical protein
MSEALATRPRDLPFATLVDMIAQTVTSPATARAYAADLDDWRLWCTLNIVAVAFCTSVRRAELAALRWADVDLDEGVIRVRHSRVCSNTAMTVSCCFCTRRGQPMRVIFTVRPCLSSPADCAGCPSAPPRRRPAPEHRRTPGAASSCAGAAGRRWPCAAPPSCARLGGEGALIYHALSSSCEYTHGSHPHLLRPYARGACRPGGDRRYCAIRSGNGRIETGITGFDAGAP